MIWVDYAILAIIAVSALVGLFRGFFREAVGLASWVIAFWLAFHFCNPVAELLQHWIAVHSIRLAVAFGIIFILVLIIGAIANFMVSKLVEQTGFAGTDRALGGVFGILRGVAILVLLVLFAGLTPVPKDNWWQQSMLVDDLQSGAIWLRDWLPRDLSKEIRYPVDAKQSNNSQQSVRNRPPPRAG